MDLIRADPDRTDWRQVAQLLAEAFAYMEARLGHPARAAAATPADLASAAREGPVFLIRDGARIAACLFCRPSRDHADALYIGRLAVAADQRGQGLARRLIDAAAGHARAENYAALTLDTGQAFPELHATFAKLGFGPPAPREGEPGVVTMTMPLDPVGPGPKSG